MTSTVASTSAAVEEIPRPFSAKKILLGKRKASQAFVNIVRRPQEHPASDNHRTVEGSYNDSVSESSGDESDIGCNKKRAISVATPSGSTASKARPKSYSCTFQGCTKAYTKPSRLTEHQRSHTGERPYTCTTCNKSYLRESHLQAHSRSHLPPSERPLPCSDASCCKRFWTKQHLDAHVAKVHRGEKPFSCPENGCENTFAKHNQLQRHIAEFHCVPGTKPYICPADGCDKSFSTNQKLRKHSKVHEANRYACTDPKCVSSSSVVSGSSVALYFSTWTALQAHLRESHPPMCSYPECDGRVFASPKGLKAHLKIHTDRHLEEAIGVFENDSTRPTKRRRGGEVGRDWICQMEGCTKAFKSKKALTTHNNITHLGRRDFICPITGCEQTFGYKHILQRHLTKVHTNSRDDCTEAEETEFSEHESSMKIISWLTGKDYSAPAHHRNTRRSLLPCPWPTGFDSDTLVGQCSYIFHRAYDLRRHLKSNHNVGLSKDEVDAWAKGWRDRHPIETE